MKPSRNGPRTGAAFLVRIVPVLLVLWAVGLASPPRASGYLCTEERQGAVVFIGSVVEGPSPDAYFPTYEGVYRFSIDQLLVGDPGNGRIYNPPGFGQGGYSFQIGGTYEVHADRATQDSWGNRLPDGVVLATGTCLATRTLNAGPLQAAVGVVAWGWSVNVMWVVIALVGALALIGLRRMRRRTEPR